MSTINRLSSVDVLQPGDQIPVWDSSNGDTRKASMSTLLAFVESYFADPDYSTRIVAPNTDYFTVDIGATGDSIWMIVNPTFNFANGTITLPPASSAVNDQEITVVFTAAVSTFIITSSGATVLGAPVSINGYDSFRVRYNAAQLTWYTLDTTGDGSGSGVSQIIRQDFTGNGTTTTFTLTTAPSALGNELQIFIDGVYQERSGYTVTGSNIIFSEAPPSLSTIEVLGWSVSIGAETTSDLVSYTVGSTGAVLTTVQAKLREYVSIEDFGASPSATATANTAAIQAALLAHKHVLIPAGTFAINGPLRIRDGGSIEGYGPYVSILSCDTVAYTGIFISMGGHTKIRHVGLAGTNPTREGTGIKLWDSGEDIYDFTGYITIEDVNIKGFQFGLYVNNIFHLDYKVGIVEQNTYGIYILPAYNIPKDNGYCTTLAFQKLTIGFNDNLGFYMNPTINSANISIKDCSIEGNSLVGLQEQSSITKCNPLVIENTYFEGHSAQPALTLVECDTSMTNCYINGTGGVDLAATANTFRGVNCYGTSATDNLIANGTSLQFVSLIDCIFPGAGSVLNATRMHMVNTQWGATVYKNTWQNPSLALTGSLGNTTNIEEVIGFTKTVTASVAAGATVALITDQASSNLWANEFVTATASLANVYLPGLILQVTPATTGSSEYFCVFAHNLTAGTLTITAATLKVLFIKGAGAAAV